MKNILFGTTYERFVLLSESSASGELWSWATWKSLFPLLERLYDLCADAPSVRCRQILKRTNSEVRFGQLPWTLEGSARWAHQSPDTEGQSEKWMFIDLQLVSPAEATLARTLTLPTLYTQIQKIWWEETEKAPIYDQILQVLIEKTLYRARQAEIEGLIGRLSEGISARAVFQSRRKLRALNEFESVLRDDFMYRGMGNQELPDLSGLKGKWSVWEGPS